MTMPDSQWKGEIEAVQSGWNSGRGADEMSQRQDMHDDDTQQKECGESARKDCRSHSATLDIRLHKLTCALLGEEIVAMIQEVRYITSLSAEFRADCPAIAG